MRERQGSGGVLGRACRGLEAERTIDFKLLEQTLEAIIVPRLEPTAAQSQHLCLDKGYDYDGPRQPAYDLIAHIRFRIEDRSATPAHPHTPRR